MRLHPLYGVGVVLSAITWALAGCGPTATQPTTTDARASSAGPDNAFVRANPGYTDRAGAFYEKEYLGKALDQLATAAELTDEHKTEARKILRAFIHDWLESYVSGDGHISSEDLARCLALMDERFQGELSAAGHKSYLAWRKDETGADNALAFLMNPRFAIQQTPAKTPKGSRPYVVTSNDGAYYSKTVPADETCEGAQGTTKVYRVRGGGDELLDSYDWHAPRQLKGGMLLDWSPMSEQVAIMRMHEEPEPFTPERIEISFYLGGKLLRSYTVKDLAALGADPVAQSHPQYTRRWLNCNIAGNWTYGPNRQRCWVVFTEDKQLYVDFVTGEIVDTPPMPKPARARRESPAD